MSDLLRPEGPDRWTVTLRGGTLSLRVDRADLPLGDLCTFGTRRNPRRSFLFISKVLGRHYPVRPRVMLDVHHRLASKIGPVPGPVLVIGMAETATGLGHGVHDALLARTGRDDQMFLPTTRYRLRQPLAFTFDESHSHATEHRVYVPHPPLRPLFDAARSLVLVDDEISTGRTLAELASRYRQHNPSLREVHFVSITDWLPDERREAIRHRVGLPVSFHSLLQGEFSFAANPGFDPGPMPDVVGRGHLIDAIVPPTQARLGIQGPGEINPRALLYEVPLERTARMLVLGTGEFVHFPFRLARWLEEQGHDVHFQSTTRSPIMRGEGAAEVMEFTDNYGDQIPNYVYNVPRGGYDRVLIGYETRPIPAEHSLAAALNAHSVCF